MTPKEKAVELFNKYQVYNTPAIYYGGDRKQETKECALIVVNEILQIKAITDDEQHQLSFEYASSHPSYRAYWELVKQEIEKL